MCVCVCVCVLTLQLAELATFRAFVVRILRTYLMRLFITSFYNILMQFYVTRNVRNVTLQSVLPMVTFVASTLIGRDFA